MAGSLSAFSRQANTSRCSTFTGTRFATARLQTIQPAETILACRSQINDAAFLSELAVRTRDGWRHRDAGIGRASFGLLVIAHVAVARARIRGVARPSSTIPTSADRASARGSNSDSQNRCLFLRARIAACDSCARSRDATAARSGHGLIVGNHARCETYAIASTEKRPLHSFLIFGRVFRAKSRFASGAAGTISGTILGTVGSKPRVYLGFSSR